jgi:hypothetical protein
METQTETARTESDKKPVSYSLTSEARRLIGELKHKKGLSQTAIVETAVREMAAREGVK